MSDQPTVAVIGAGFSGLLTALRLLSLADGPRVRLVERRRQFAKGAAYATLDDEHLLNVRAVNMSAFPEAPDHFVAWLTGAAPEARQSGFVRRSLYGAYLQTMIQKAVESAPAGRLILEADAAMAVEPTPGGWRINLAMGRAFTAQAVVLAVGNLTPPPPRAVTAAAAASPAFIGDPWSLDTLDPPGDGLAVIIGTGLTMVDVALHLSRRRPGLSLLGLSRRGLLPRRHLDEGPLPKPMEAAPAGGPLAILRLLRAEARTGDWRPALDGLRPHVHAVWRAWTPTERLRFLRHARPWWDVHRHRLAPPAAKRLDHLFASGRLTVEAARLTDVSLAGDGLKVTSRPRGGRRTDERLARLVVNCPGPSGDAAAAAEPLLSAALAAGLVRADPQGLGLEVDERWRLLDAAGRPHETLFAAGPITRGSVFEITSVPDIRIQARDLAHAAAEAVGAARHTLETDPPLAHQTP